MVVSFKFFGVTIGNHRRQEHRYIPHSLNHALHWRKRALWTQAWKEAVWHSVLQYKKTLGKVPLDHPTVKIILHSIHKMDRDNAWSAAKPIIDGLRYAGVLFDDRNEDFECDVKWQKADHIPDQGVEVIIEF